MKKFYTILLGVAIAITASAASPFGKLQLNHKAVQQLVEHQNIEINKAAKQAGIMEYNGSDASINELAQRLMELQKEASASQATNTGSNRIGIKEDWEDLGTVTFIDSWLLPCLYSQTVGVSLQEWCNAFAWTVPVQRSTKSEMRFKLVAPYHQPEFKAFFINEETGEDMGIVNFKDEDRDIIIDCTDPTNVRMDLQPAFELLDEDEDGNPVSELIYIWTASDYFQTVQMATPAQIESTGFQLSTYNAGTIDLCEGVFGVDSDVTSEAAYNWTSGTARASVTFAGAKDYSLRTAVSAEHISEGEFAFAWQAGADVATVKAAYMPGLSDITASDAIFDLLESEQYASQLETLPETEGETAVETDQYDGPAALFILAYNEAGERVKGVVYNLHITFRDAENWKEVGKAKFTDEIVSTFWVFKDATGNTIELKETPSWDVTVEEHVAIPGYYRLVNPYLSVDWQFVTANRHTSEDCYHYLYIDARDRNAVEVRPSYPGYWNSYGCLSVYSINISAETPDPALSGKFDTNSIISFPAKSIISAYSNDWVTDEQTGELYQPAYFANFNAPLTIDFSNVSSGIESSVIDTTAKGPVEYYNLQGVRVFKPAAGELVIKRQGDKVEKTIVR